ncbi:hypothetical protein GIB67_032536 [Kingdonia uniflora]|uniref:CCHC-type domain-containing protein n=1 Tax=Kingdonia uniflora TaxID=39325 RepID=A0A7J7L7S7_9MAGN|nr:hypothetical protein GIB67_032536 [Kingdonia uniflora]
MGKRTPKKPIKLTQGERLKSVEESTALLMESNKELTASNKLMTKQIEAMLVVVMASLARVASSEVEGDEVDGSEGGSRYGNQGNPDNQVANAIIYAFQNLNSDVKINVLDFDGKSDADRFIDLLNRVESQRVSRFRLGLTKHIQDEMILFSPQSLSEIVEMARKVEAKLKPSGYSSFTALATTTATVTMIPTSTTPAVGSKPTGTVSLAICYNCGKTGHMRQECPSPRKAMTLISQQLHDHVDEALEQLLSPGYGDAEVIAVDLLSP